MAQHKIEIQITKQVDRDIRGIVAYENVSFEFEYNDTKGWHYFEHYKGDEKLLYNDNESPRDTQAMIMIKLILDAYIAGWREKQTHYAWIEIK